MSHPVRPEDMRASDAEREVVQQLLHRAHAEGSLDLTEFDQRVVATWQAKTRGELAALTADLPQVHPAPRPTPPVKAKKSGGRTALRVLTTIWASVSALNFAIWLLVSILGGEGLVHPWFLWVALPWGSVLGVVWLLVGREPGQR
ncbi:DUF1707 SHOCT-like domain-containing protein [Saccharothrix variisporea]|uniref:DUF1707 SHOCT-like domain-containing protein n=1 Tax=Saccharothrix variisporea TaxID=543527 RepID=UPI00147705A5|nr:DUF1707 domain-containing protein [Saccharothrix variisporea]